LKFQNTDMKIFQKIAIASLLFCYNLQYGQYTDQINSNRPGSSQGAYSVGKNVIQAEGGIYYIKENHNLLNYESKGFGTDITLRGGLLREQLEFNLEGKFQFDKYTVSDISVNRSGFKELVFGAKYLFYDPFKNYKDKPNIYSYKANHAFKWRQFRPAVSLFVGGNYVMKNSYTLLEDKVLSPKAAVILQNQFKSGLVIVTNIIADKIGTPTSSFGYIITFTKGINEKLSIFFENKGIKGNYYSDGIVTGGATYLLQNNIQIDASISTNIKDTPNLLFGGIGMSWRFDKKYKNIEIKDGKEDKEKSKKDDKKNKSKRLDELDGDKKQ
jgi:Putative MetA-pathway of phenol degradation